MGASDPFEVTRRLAAESVVSGRSVELFERLYAAAEQGAAMVPWDRGVAHPLLVDWFQSSQAVGAGRTAMVVGCGFGSDAELVAAHQFITSAFDVSASAIRGAHKRNPASAVAYHTADLLDLPSAWLGAFDLVVEIMTVQSLPVELRNEAIHGVTSLVAPGGTLIVIASALEEGPSEPDERDGLPPWPLSRADVESFASDSLTMARIELIPRRDEPWGRWRVELRRDS